MITLSDGVIDAKEIDQWKQILNEYEESLKEITTPKKRRKDRFKNNSRTDGQRPIERSDKSITTTEEVINIYSPPYDVIKRRIIVF